MLYGSENTYSIQFMTTTRFINRMAIYTAILTMDNKLTFDEAQDVRSFKDSDTVTGC